MTDLYDYYERLLTSMANVDFDNLPSPRQILEEACYDLNNIPAFVGTIPIIDAGFEHNHQDKYAVVKLGSEYIKISASYDGEYGLGYDYDVQIVAPFTTQIRSWTPV